MSLTVELPWPKKALHPNARVHWSTKAKAAKVARSGAGWLTIQAIGRDITAPVGTERISLALTFNPPDKRRRDVDGMLSACKPQLDGIADALMIDDSLFDLTLTVGEPVKDGLVTASIRLAKGQP